YTLDNNWSNRNSATNSSPQNTLAIYRINSLRISRAFSLTIRSTKEKGFRQVLLSAIHMRNPSFLIDTYYWDYATMNFHLDESYGKILSECMARKVMLAGRRSHLRQHRHLEVVCMKMA